MASDSRKPHDLGGLAAGPVEREEREIAYWEQRIDAMVSLCFSKGVLGDVAELRAGIEALGPEAYDSLGYYERWAASMADRLVARKVLTQQELDERIELMRARFGRS